MTSKELIVIGASDTFELAEAALGPEGHSIIGYLAPEPNNFSMYQRYPYLGNDDVISSGKYPDAGYVLALADNARRREIFKAVIAAGNEAMTVVHPQAILYPSATLSRGTLMAPLVVISSLAEVGDGVYFNYASHVGHDVTIGDFCFLGPGSKLFGEVEVGSGVLLGANVVVFPQIKIGDNARIAANTVVVRDVPPGVTLMSSQQTRTLRL